MQSALVALLTICVATAQVNDPEVAPDLPPLPPGLSAPKVQPDGTVCLPPDLADAVDTERENCHKLPARCQGRLNILRERCMMTQPSWWNYIEAGIVGTAVGVVLTMLAFGFGGSR